jgi:subtilisin family serine protease
MTDIHPDLQSEPGVMPKVVMLQSFAGRDTAYDPTGHGTHMAATIAGSGKASNGRYQGIAPGASLYFQALLNKANQLQLPDNLEDLFSPAYSAGVRVHVNGWGSGSNTYGNNSAQIDDFVYRYYDFLPVFAAGNSGPISSSLTSEANSKNVLTVGSSQVPRPAFSPEACYADQIADSSSRGPAGDGRIKPELLAPGSAVISACSSLATSNFSANTAYTRMGGSSMAAAVTGGAVALLR